MTEVEDSFKGKTYFQFHPWRSKPSTLQDKIHKAPIFRPWTADTEGLWCLREGKHTKWSQHSSSLQVWWQLVSCGPGKQSPKRQDQPHRGKETEIRFQGPGVTRTQVETSQKGWLRNIPICNFGHRPSCSSQRQDCKVAGKEQILGVVGWMRFGRSHCVGTGCSPDHPKWGESTEHLGFLYETSKKASS